MMLILLSAACSNGGEKTTVAPSVKATPTAAVNPTGKAAANVVPTAPDGKRCGDGICGGRENAQNCAADCSPPSTVPMESPTLAPTATEPPKPPTPTPVAADAITPFAPAPVPTPVARSEGEQPLYFYLFTHTEDQFNHDLSEERYTRLVPIVEELAASHPDAHLTWTIMFQGSDAQSVAERNSQTGVADLLRAANTAGVVSFGFHGHHDATYLNRPQSDFNDNTSWEDLVTGMVDWLGCEKDPVLGGCLAPTGGGLYAVQNNFGDVQAASGIFLQSETAFQGGATTHATLSIRPDLLLGFGYPDHGIFVESGHREKVGELMARLAPAADTSGTIFWADNFIKMNGGNPIDDTRGIDPLKGSKYAAGMLAGLDRSRPNIILTGLASKYLYTKSGTSPTKYGYVHPEAPELPPEWLNTTQQKERYYQQSVESLNYLLDDVLPNNPGSRFLSSADIIAMVAPPEYWTVSPELLDALSRWALLNWTDRPPDWVSDGTDFYSLRDLFSLLVRSLGDDAGAGTTSIVLPTAYGPLKPVDAQKAVTLSRDEIVALAAELAPNFAPNQPWQVTPGAMVQPTYPTSAGEITAAQLLYGMATVYAADFAGAPVSAVQLPATQAMPVTYDLLTDIGCLNTCSGTAWSFKPARLRLP